MLRGDSPFRRRARVISRRGRVQVHRMALEGLESRDLLAVTFQIETPISVPGANYPKSIFSADFDGDDDADIVVATLVDNKVSWYENLDGAGNYSEQQVISSVAIGAASVYAADINGDGKTDVISGGNGAYDSDVSWYRNEGDGQFSDQLVISAEVDATDSVFAADLDGDGDQDVLSASRGDNKLAWYENQGDGTFLGQEVITDQAEGATSVVATDLNGDGNVDVVLASYDDNSVRWYPNDGGTDFPEEILLTNTAERVTAVSIADMNGDERPDIVITSRDDDSLSWFVNEGNGEFSAERFISLDDDGPNELFLGDLDGDDLPDISVAVRQGDRITWYKNMGDGLFDGPRVVNSDTDGASAVFAVDVDGDGDRDLFSTSRFDNKVALHRNLDGLGAFGEEEVFTDDGFPGAQHVSTGDVDGDGDQDVLAASLAGDRVSWFENLGRGRFGEERVISTNVNAPEILLVADLDKDGDNDAVSVSYLDDKIAWYENLDGLGSFGPQRIITGDTDGPEFAEIADINGDGNLDVVSASRNDGKLAWYAGDGQGNFGFQVVLGEPQESSAPTYLATADLDGDGDLDVITNGYDRENGKVSWFENVDGDGTFGNENIVTLDVFLPTALAPADFDGDGDIDVAVTSGDDDRVLWFENLNGDGDFDDGRLIDDALDGGFDIQPVDFDLDGDMDLVSVALLGDEVVWYENVDGQFGLQQKIATGALAPTSVAVADLDGDGDPDVLSSDNLGDQIAWYRNGEEIEVLQGDLNDDGTVDLQDTDLLCQDIRLELFSTAADLDSDGDLDLDDLSMMISDLLDTSIGDVNGDGVFDTNDFVFIFIAGEYEDAIEDNSMYTEGDWNCDGDFTSEDLVTALIGGGFVPGAQPAALDIAAIAAATDFDEDFDNKGSRRTTVV